MIECTTESDDGSLAFWRAHSHHSHAKKHLPRGFVMVFAVPTLIPLVNSSVSTDVGMKYGCTTAFFVVLGALLLEELANVSCGACISPGMSKAWTRLE